MVHGMEYVLGGANVTSLGTTLSSATLAAIMTKAALKRIGATEDERALTMIGVACAIITIALCALRWSRPRPDEAVSKTPPSSPVKSPVTPHPSDLGTDLPFSPILAPQYEESADAAAVADARAAYETVELCRSAAATEAASTTSESPFLRVISFDLAAPAASVFDSYWADEHAVAAAAADDEADAEQTARSFYPYFLNARCANTGARAQKWAADARRGSWTRRVDTLHPLATSIRVPGFSLPSIPTVKVQRAYESVDDGCALAITEASRFDKIPYAAALRVETTWCFLKAEAGCRVSVYYRCVFLKEVLSIPGWIQRYCVTQTKTELATTLGKWLDAASEALETPAEPEEEAPPADRRSDRRRERRPPPPPRAKAAEPQQQQQSIFPLCGTTGGGAAPPAPPVDCPSPTAARPLAKPARKGCDESADNAASPMLRSPMRSYSENWDDDEDDDASVDEALVPARRERVLLDPADWDDAWDDGWDDEEERAFRPPSPPPAADPRAASPRLRRWFAQFSGH